MQFTLDDNEFQRLSQYIQKEFGINLSQKRLLIVSRLSAPVMELGYPDLSSFVRHLLDTKDADEITMLLDKLTTNYTYFMREVEHFQYFSKKILPELVRRHEHDKKLYIWSAGCSTGEEPYNISMYIKDYLGPKAAQWDTRILATDISENVIGIAKAGIYELPETVPDKWKKEYFTRREDGRYAVAPVIRNNVIFRKFNLMNPIKFKHKFDLIFCRNVMIYFNQPTKEALVNRFFDATEPGGYFLIGYSENISPESPYQRLAASTFRRPSTFRSFQQGGN